MWCKILDIAVGDVEERRLEEEEGVWREVLGCEEAEAFGLCLSDVEEGG